MNKNTGVNDHESLVACAAFLGNMLANESNPEPGEFYRHPRRYFVLLSSVHQSGVGPAANIQLGHGPAGAGPSPPAPTAERRVRSAPLPAPPSSSPLSDSARRPANNNQLEQLELELQHEVEEVEELNGQEEEELNHQATS
eukprot:CAMPEP_0178981904 /NCGR_PEP_ID=MMETSP0795-20121207/200_1 /TAXON_ID=88552 /ORGANISM="Amoebophrya sp., Strain Ameob2" /LENGTH=140 /DNA_ID=CAMNT_0020672491 /DNA_START=1008 /DNA_END=1434 /DNA_ORIENTATION=+